MMRNFDDGSWRLPISSLVERKVSRSGVKSSTAPGIGGWVTAVS